MTIETLRARLSPALLDWFRAEIDKGDAPELHLINLTPGELVRCFAAINDLGPRWNWRTFYIDDVPFPRRISTPLRVPAPARGQPAKLGRWRRARSAFFQRAHEGSARLITIGR